jgi:hypothetical protein
MKPTNPKALLSVAIRQVGLYRLQNWRKTIGSRLFANINRKQICGVDRRALGGWRKTRIFQPVEYLVRIQSITPRNPSDIFLAPWAAQSGLGQLVAKREHLVQGAANNAGFDFLRVIYPG